MFQMKLLCVLILLPIIFSEASYVPRRHKCGKLAYWKVDHCVCNAGCKGNPAYGYGCHYVKPLGPSIHQVRKFNSGVNSQVNSILNQDHRIQAGETSEINSGVRSDMRGVYKGNRRTNLRGDVRNLNRQADYAQRQGRRHQYGAAAGVAGCGPFTRFVGSKCICLPGCYGRPYSKKGCFRKCGKFAYRRGKRCYCKRNFKGDPYKVCFRSCGLNAYTKKGKCFCNKGYSGNPKRICYSKKPLLHY